MEMEMDWEAEVKVEELAAVHVEMKWRVSLAAAMLET